MIHFIGYNIEMIRRYININTIEHARFHESIVNFWKCLDFLVDNDIKTMCLISRKIQERELINFYLFLKDTFFAEKIIEISKLFEKINCVLISGEKKRENTELYLDFMIKYYSIYTDIIEQFFNKINIGIVQNVFTLYLNDEIKTELKNDIEMWVKNNVENIRLYSDEISESTLYMIYHEVINKHIDKIKELELLRSKLQNISENYDKENIINFLRYKIKLYDFLTRISREVIRFM